MFGLAARPKGIIIIKKTGQGGRRQRQAALYLGRLAAFGRALRRSQSQSQSQSLLRRLCAAAAAAALRSPAVRIQPKQHWSSSPGPKTETSRPDQAEPRQSQRKAGQSRERQGRAGQGRATRLEARPGMGCCHCLVTCSLLARSHSAGDPSAARQAGSGRVLRVRLRYVSVR